MSTRFMSGKDGKVVVGGQTLKVQGWKLALHANLIDSTHSESSGWMVSVPGIRSGSGSFEALWDAGASPLASPPNLSPGGANGNTKLSGVTFGFETGSPTFTFDCYVEDFDTDLTVTGDVKYSVKFKCDGAITYPTTAF